jgi:hypothetical protein
MRNANVAACDGKVVGVDSGLGSAYHNRPCNEGSATMTTRTPITLPYVVEMGADADLLRQMIEQVVEHIMAFGVENLCNAG